MNNKIPSVHESIENIFLRRNPECKREELQWRSDQRLEWVCEHGVGHTVFDFESKNKNSSNFIHGCDRCCLNKVIFKIIFHDERK